MQLSILSSLWSHGHAAEVPADRIESQGRVPRSLRLLPNFVPPAGQDEITDWIGAHVSWSIGTSFGNRRETFMQGRNPLPEWGVALGRRMTEAGYRWQHGVLYTREDQFRGQVYPRTNGISATWRLLPPGPQ